jgi:hypothetical protein
MRILSLSFVIAVTILSCKNGDKSTVTNEAALKDSANFTTIQWLDSTNKDFGKIAEGQKLEVSFRFKNSGNKPLVIARVQPSCGCTVAEQPTEPIAPGNEGTIKAVFDSEHHEGSNHKTLFVYANTKSTQANELKFAVVVEKKKW